MYRRALNCHWGNMSLTAMLGVQCNLKKTVRWRQAGPPCVSSHLPSDRTRWCHLCGSLTLLKKESIGRDPHSASLRPTVSGPGAPPLYFYCCWYLSPNYQDMVLWSLLPISLSLVSLIGTWVTYGLAYSYDHVCSLNNWAPGNHCRDNTSIACCQVPTISSSGTSLPESSLFTATFNAGSFLFMVFCIFHHAHIMERNSVHSMLSRIALVFGGVAAVGAFVAGNCNPEYLKLAHYLGAAVSFLCICFYSLLLTVLTRKCVLTRMEWFLYPARVTSTGVQIIVTIGYTVLFVQEEYLYKHSAAVFEWIMSVNLELFELSFAVEFCFFSSSMLSTLLVKREEEKPILLA